MEVTQTNAEGLKREFKVVIAAPDIEEKVDARLTELSHTITMPGFRPGKVPVSLVKTRYGGKVRDEVVEDALREGSQEAIAQHELRPALEPKIEVTRFEHGSDLEYTISLEVMPEIEPTDITKLSLERLVCEVSDSDVETALKQMAEQTKSFKPSPESYEAKSGDTLVIDFLGKIDGEPFEGGSAQDHQLELGTSVFVESFEDQLIGVKAGEHREINVTFPEAYANEKFAGKEALFEVDVKEVKQALPVAVDDALAQNLGLDNLEALRRAVRKQIEQERASLSRARLKRALLDVLAERHHFEVPPSMAEMEYESIWGRLQDDLGRAGTSLQAEGHDEEQTKESYRRIAERRVRLGLVLAEIGRRNNIEVLQEELNRAIVEHARRFPGEERKVLEHFQQHPEAAEQLRAPLFEEKVVDFITEMAQISERKASLDELLQEAEDPIETGIKKKAEAGKKVAGKARRGRASSRRGKAGKAGKAKKEGQATGPSSRDQDK